MFPVWLQAGFWGLVAGSALLVGAALGYFARLPQRLTAAIMAFGSGVLISALSFDLMDEAYKRGGFDSTAIGFVGGATIFTAANWYLSRHGAKHRKRSGGQQTSEEEHSGSGSAIVIGVSMIRGGAVSTVAGDSHLPLESTRRVIQFGWDEKSEAFSKLCLWGLDQHCNYFRGGRIAWIYNFQPLLRRGPCRNNRACRRCNPGHAVRHNDS